MAHFVGGGGGVAAEFVGVGGEGVAEDVLRPGDAGGAGGGGEEALEAVLGESVGWACLGERVGGEPGAEVCADGDGARGGCFGVGLGEEDVFGADVCGAEAEAFVWAEAGEEADGEVGEEAVGVGLGVGEECAGLVGCEDGAAWGGRADGGETFGGVVWEESVLGAPGEDGGEGTEELVVHGRGEGCKECAEGARRVGGEVVAKGADGAGGGLAVALEGLGAEVFAGGGEGGEEVFHRSAKGGGFGDGLGGLGEGGAGGEEGEGGFGVAELRGGEGDGVSGVLGVEPRLGLGEGAEAGAAAAVGEVGGGVVAASVRGAGDAAVAVAGGGCFHVTQNNWQARRLEGRSRRAVRRRIFAFVRFFGL